MYFLFIWIDVQGRLPDSATLDYKWNVCYMKKIFLTNLYDTKCGIQYTSVITVF